MLDSPCLTAEPSLRHPVIEALSADATARIVAASERRLAEPRARLLTEGQRVLSVRLLLRGTARVFHRSPDGVELLRRRLRPPALLGAVECMTGLPAADHAETLERSTLLEIPGALFRRCIETSPAAALRLLDDFGEQLHVGAENERALAFYPVRARLAVLLAAHALFDGLPVEGGRRARLPMGQEEMAGALGVTRRAVAREIARWQRLGILGRVGRAYLVTDLERLRAEARGLRPDRLYGLGEGPRPPRPDRPQAS